MTLYLLLILSSFVLGGKLMKVESLGLHPGATRKQVESKMRGYILSEGYTVGRYKRG